MVGIGASLGGPTGYAINPARDLGPRIAHALLPIRGKGSSDWAYSWVPVLGPLVGGAIAGLVAVRLHRLTPQHSRPPSGRRSTPPASAVRATRTTGGIFTMPDTKYVLAIDQGTTSSRAIVFDHSGQIVESGQIEHEQIFPRAGWVEHNAEEIWKNVREVVGLALTRANLTYKDLAAVGITNQRETAVVWDRTTGKPVYNAIVWQDTRTQKIADELGALGGGADRYKAKVGLPLATYFSGPKVKWILDNVEGARAKAEAGDLAFGNTDSWVLWNMTGGVDGGVHVTDPTNASRTMLMDLDTLTWDEDIANDMGIPLSMLPEIRSSSEVYGKGREGGMVPGVPIAGILGDQQAATFGQACFEVGMAKNTYGTGNFMLINTGT